MDVQLNDVTVRHIAQGEFRVGYAEDPRRDF